MELEKNLPAVIKSPTIAEKAAPWFDKAERLQLKMQTITQITNDEEDQKANAIMVEVRTVYEVIESERKKITSEFERIKQILMQPEKALGEFEGSEFLRLKKLRNNYAQSKSNKIEAEKKKIEEERIQKEKLIEYNAFVNSNLALLIAQKAAAWSEKIQSSFDDIDSEEKANAFYTKLIQLKELYTKGGNFLNQADFEKCLETKDAPVIDNKSELYQNANNQLIETCLFKIKWFAGQEATVRLNLKQALKDQKDIKAVQSIEAEEIKQHVSEQLIAQAEEIKKQAEAEKINTDFNAQISVQSLQDEGNVRKTYYAVLSADEYDILAVLFELFKLVVTHPKFKGVYKTDKKGTIKKDSEGNYIYTDIVDELLKFYAAECRETPLPGVIVKTKVAAIVKK